MTAQRILSAHLNPEAAATFWANIDLDLTNAHLHQLNLVACHLRKAQFDWATFAEYAGFSGATLTGDAWFDGVTFTGDAWFDGVTFAGSARFYEATFTGAAWFNGARVAQLGHVVLPMGWTTRPAAEGEDEGWLYLVRDEDSTEQPTEAPG